MKTIGQALNNVWQAIRGLPETFIYKGSAVYIRHYHIEKYVVYGKKTDKPRYYTRLVFDIFFLSKNGNRSSKAAGWVTPSKLEQGLKDGSITPVDPQNMPDTQNTLGSRHKVKKWMLINIREDNTSGIRTDVVVQLHDKLVYVKDIWLRRSRLDGFPFGQWIEGYGFLNRSSNGLSMSHISHEERNDESTHKHRRSPRHVFSHVSAESIELITQERLNELALEYLV